jgi:hypothetical protein
VQSGGKKAKELGSIEVNLGDFAANNTSVSKDFKFAKYLLPALPSACSLSHESTHATMAHRFTVGCARTFLAVLLHPLVTAVLSTPQDERSDEPASLGAFPQPACVSCVRVCATCCVLLTRLLLVLMQVHIKSQWAKINGKLMVKKCDPHTLTSSFLSRFLFLTIVDSDRSGSGESGQDDYDLVTDDEGSDTSEISELDTDAESDTETDVRQSAPAQLCLPTNDELTLLGAPSSGFGLGVGRRFGLGEDQGGRPRQGERRGRDSERERGRRGRRGELEAEAGGGGEEDAGDGEHLQEAAQAREGEEETDRARQAGQEET